MRGSLRLLGALWVAFATAAGAQEETLPQVFEDAIDVRAVNVETVVTDADGRPVRGLKAEDFRLLVDGREVPITFFDEVAEGSSVTAGGEAVGRSYLVFIDDGFSLAAARDAVLEKLERDLGLLGPADQMAVLASDGRQIDVLARWTDDRARLAAALAAARERPAQGNRMILSEQAAVGRHRRRRGRPGARPAGVHPGLDVEPDPSGGADAGRLLRAGGGRRAARVRDAARAQAHAAALGSPVARPRPRAVLPADRDGQPARLHGLPRRGRHLGGEGGRRLRQARAADRRPGGGHVPGRGLPRGHRGLGLLLLARLHPGVEGGRLRAPAERGGPAPRPQGAGALGLLRPLQADPEPGAHRERPPLRRRGGEPEADHPARQARARRPQGGAGGGDARRARGRADLHSQGQRLSRRGPAGRLHSTFTLYDQVQEALLWGEAEFAPAPGG